MTTPPAFVFGSFSEGELASILKNDAGAVTSASSDSAAFQKAPDKLSKPPAPNHALPGKHPSKSPPHTTHGTPPQKDPPPKSSASKLNAASPPFTPGVYLTTPPGGVPVLAPVTPLPPARTASLPKVPSEPATSRASSSPVQVPTENGVANGSPGVKGQPEPAVTPPPRDASPPPPQKTWAKLAAPTPPNHTPAPPAKAVGTPPQPPARTNSPAPPPVNPSPATTAPPPKSPPATSPPKVAAPEKDPPQADPLKEATPHTEEASPTSPPEPRSPFPPQARQAPKSWAALLTPEGGFPQDPPKKGGPEKGVANGGGAPPEGPVLFGDSFVESMRGAEARGPPRLVPRGLLNTGNSCFLNSTLQALMSCSPFLHLLRQLEKKKVNKGAFPTLSAFIDFVSHFEVLPPMKPPPGPRRPPGGAGGVEPGGGAGGSHTSTVLDVDRPFAPEMFSEVLQRFSPPQTNPSVGGGVKGKGGYRARSRQEDAQEFLSFVMDRIHEELLRLEKEEGGPLEVVKDAVEEARPEEEEEDDEWETVGPKNRTAVTRTHSLQQSALMSIFGGQLQSVVKTKGNRASATIQPFTLLQLDIVPEAVFAVEDALQLLAAPETLDGYRGSKGHSEVAASKVIKIQVLPRVLVLHLMRFTFSGDVGMAKVHKQVRYPPTLTLPAKILAAAPPPPIEARRYELIATVSHHGKDPSGGHYTADAVQPDGRWLRFDDGQVSVVGLGRVLNEQAYMLVYKRLSM